MDKRTLTETEIRNRFIRPAIVDAGWDESDLREEYYFTDGRMLIDGKRAAPRCSMYHH